MKLLTLFVLSAGLIVLTPLAARSDCYHACFTVDVSVGDGIYLTSVTDQTDCESCSDGDPYEYTFLHYDACSGSGQTPGSFCSLDGDLPVLSGSDSWFYVDSIGAGCDGYAEPGCVRFCDCP